MILIELKKIFLCYIKCGYISPKFFPLGRIFPPILRSTGSVDLPNSIFHYNHEQHKDLFKDEVKIEFSVDADTPAYKTYSIMNFKNNSGKPSYSIPIIKEINEPSPDPEPGHYKSNDYPTIFIKTTEGWDVNFNDMMDQWGNDIPSEIYPLATVYVCNKNDTNKFLLQT